MYNSLQDFIKYLEKEGDLIRITEPVCSELEITEIHRRVLAEGGPALIFENVIDKNNTQHNMPVIVNLFGTQKRIESAMGTSKDSLRDIGQMLAFLRQPEPPEGWREAVDMIPLLKKIMAMKPKIVKKAACQEVVLTGDDVDLSQLPIQKCWPDDISKLITWPLIVTSSSRKADNLDINKSSKNNDRKASDETYNLGIYRMQVLSKNQTIMRWLKHRGGAQHHRDWEKISTEPMPAAAVIGCDPSTILAAVTPIPDNLSEYDFAGLLRGKKLELVDCKTIPLQVPANAEIILEGHISLQDYHDEGPFGDHTGYYNDVEQFPVFTISAITMRKKPIYLSTYTGKPPDEPSILGEALNEVFIPILQQQFPEIVDFYLPPEGCSYRVAVISIKKSYAGHAKRIMMGAWSYLRQFMYTKFIIIVDEDINCRDWKEVIWAISTCVEPARDFVTIENTPIDYLDFASVESGLGSKVGIDATSKIHPETKRNWGKKIDMSDDIIAKVTENWDKYGIHSHLLFK